jgi:hypothetical protein
MIRKIHNNRCHFPIILLSDPATVPLCDALRAPLPAPTGLAKAK